MPEAEKKTKKKKSINWIKILFWVSLISIATIWYLGLLDPLKSFLNSKELKFKVGKVSLTPFVILKAFVLLIALLWLAGKTSSGIEKILRRSSRVRASDRALTVKILNIILYVVSFMIILSALGIDLTTITVFGGALGIGIGFGLQKIASNFISGIILLFERTINEGDLVELPGTTAAFVRRTSARYTLLETYDGKEIMIPNEDFITNRVTNYTFSNKIGRMELNISIAAESDPVKAREIIIRAAKSHRLSSRWKVPECYLLNLGQNSMDFKLQVWLDDITEGQYTATNDILFDILEQFRSNGIKLPHTKMDINITGDRDGKI